MGEPARERGPNKVAQCVDWLKTFLADYAFPDDEIQAGAQEHAGFTFDNVKHAKTILRRDGGMWSRCKGFRGKWWNGFGDPDTCKLRPVPQSGDNGSGSSPHSPHSPPDWTR